MIRILSLLVAIANLGMAYVFGSSNIFRVLIPFQIIGIACIWFGDSLGSITGFRWIGNINITQETPGSVIRVLGWILLLLIPSILLIF